MARYLGLDGFRNGWVAVYLNSRQTGEIEFLDHIDDLRTCRYRMAAIDIPIGLPDQGNRPCDMAARQMLGINRNRVFTGARRPLLAFCKDYKKANRAGKALGAGISRQLFGILCKIKQVDTFMQRAGQGRLRECHPELVFQRLGGRALESKKTDKGRKQRRKILSEYFSNLDALINKRLGTGAKHDDVLDACACAIAARDCARGRKFVVQSGKKRDGRNLKMEIWY